MFSQKLRVASDLHSECWWGDASRIHKVLPELEDDKTSCLLLAGDIGNVKNLEVLVKLMEEAAQRFKHIYYEFGNHECWGATSLGNGEELIWAALDHIPNLSVGLTRDTLKNKPQRQIHMQTLWTDFDGNDEDAKQEAKQGMADYYRIGNFTPEMALEEHRLAVETLARNIMPLDVVMTHHLPSFKSCDTQFKDSPLNPAFASNLEAMVIKLKPQLWVHGHTHASCDYQLGQTRILCNPYGYYSGGLNSEYNPTLEVKLI